MKKFFPIALALLAVFIVAAPFLYVRAQDSPPPAWCTESGGTPIWNVYDGEMAGGTWDCYYLNSCADTGQTGTYPNCRDYTCQDYGFDTGTYPDCRNYTCQDYGYEAGTVGSCYNDACPSDAGVQQYASQCSSPPPTCTDNSYCSGTTYISSNTCGGQTGSTPNSPSCGYVPPSSCTPSSACAASTPVGSTCYDSCGNGYAGTVAASCGTPSATLTANPSRVRSGQTSTLTLSATGVTTSCTITGPGINSVTAASSCGVSKTIVTPPITSQVTYKVTCDSSVDLAKVIVNLTPRFFEF